MVELMLALSFATGSEASCDTVPLLVKGPSGSGQVRVPEMRIFCRIPAGTFPAALQVIVVGCPLTLVQLHFRIGGAYDTRSKASTLYTGRSAGMVIVACKLDVDDGP